MTKKLLVPIDLNHEGVFDSVFAAVHDLAAAEETGVDLITVVPDLDVGVFPYVTAEQLQELLDLAQERLVEIGRKHLGERLTWHADAVPGPVARTIIDLADERDADFIVMASHNPAFSDIIFGSVASQVVKHAHRSVVIVRQPEGDDSDNR